MNDYTSQPIEIDLKDLMCFVLKKWGVLLIAGVICAVLLSSFKYVSDRKKSATPAIVTNVLDIDVMLPGETEEEYNNRVKTVNNARDVMTNIVALTDLAAIQNEYINSSIYMDLDPLNVATSNAQVLLTLDSDALYGHREALENAYSYDLISGDYLDDTASEYGYDKTLIIELISVRTSTDSDGVNLIEYGSGENVILLTLSVCGPSIEFTDAVLDSMLDEVANKASELSSTVVRHSMTVTGRQSYVSFSAEVRDSQVVAVNTLNTLYSQINSENGILDNLAKQLGLTDRNDFYELINEETNVSEPAVAVSFKDIIKFCLIGFVVGLIIIAAYYAVAYIMGRKIITQAQFSALYSDVKIIGVSKPLGKRTALNSFLDRMSGDDSKVSADNINKIIGANYGNLTLGMNKILITGTADKGFAKKAVKEFGLNGDIEFNLFENPSVLRDASSYDGIVLIEQRGLSEKRVVSDELSLLKNSGAKIVGAIIL